MEETMKPIGPVKALKSGKPIIAFIRDPIERIQSAYRFLRDKGAYYEKFDKYEDFVDNLLSQADDNSTNIHWRTQKRICSFEDEFILDRWYRFEDLTEIWGSLGLPKLRTTNISVKHPVSDYQLYQIQQRYREDYKLRDGVSNS